MSLVKKLVLAILAVSLVTFVALFGRLPAFRKTPIGYMNRLIWVKLPGLFLRIDSYLTGGRSAKYLKQLGHYLMDENHPLILIFYMSLIFGAECLFIPSAWPYLDQRHRITTSALIAFVYAFTYMCVMSKSSTITANNHREQMSRYPYDHVLFRPGRTCQTCQLVKPARSKHCAICNVCVAKHDHHCIWVMNCLGRENYVFFMSLLLSLSALLSWGAYLAYGILDRILQNNLSHDDGVISSIHWSQGKTWSQYFHMLGWAFAKDFSIGGVGMLALLTAPLAYGLLFYHIYLIWAGMTTNESFKWAMWKDDITDGYVYKDGEPTDHEEQTRDLEIEPYVDWPIASNQKLFNRTEENAEHRDLVSAKWIRVKGLDEIDNIYDLGFLNNLRDALRIL